MNRVCLIGRIVDDPIVTASTKESRILIARFTIATDRFVGGRRESDFIRCVAFGKNAEFYQKWVRKGMKLAIDGNIRTSNYTDKEGKKHYSTEVVSDRQEFVERKSDNDAYAGLADKEEKKEPALGSFGDDDVYSFLDPGDNPFL